MNKKYTKVIRSLCIVASVIALSACTDSDYDFNDIDATVGIGGEDISIPGGNTDVIKLDDVLEIESTDCVQIRENGDYVFSQESAGVEASHPSMNVITITEQSSSESQVPFVYSARSLRAVDDYMTASGIIYSFDYSGDKPDGVVSINIASTTSTFELNIVFSNSLSQLISTLENLIVKFPACMTLSNVNSSESYTQSGSELRFAGVPTNRTLVIRGNISELDFTNTDYTLGQITLNENTVDLTGRIAVEASFDASSLGNMTSVNTSDLYISSSLSLSAFVVTGATGRFNPDIDMTDLGTVEVSGVPDFLTEGNVVIDLYNPQILLSVYSDMNIPGFVSGTLTAEKDGMETARVNIPEMYIKPLYESIDGYTDICVCRRADAVDADGYDEVVEVSNLSDLIKIMPDNISFVADARADASRESQMTFGHSYNVQPNYKIEAPLAFDKDARIVYTDTIDDWNEDIDNLELASDAYITVTGIIDNHVPAYLTLEANAIDVDKNLISSDDIEIIVSNQIIASSDGETSVSTPITVTLKQKRKGVIKRLNGVVLTFSGDATSEDGTNCLVGKTLNAYNHYIVARDIKIKLTGKIIADFN